MNEIFQVTPGELADANAIDIVAVMVKSLDAKKASDIKVLRIEEKTVLADYFVICNGTSTTQVKTLADEVEYQLNRGNAPYVRFEGNDCIDWKVVDTKDVILHVFTNEAREYYKLEKLWADAEEININNFLNNSTEE
ncbi:MAG: ribosome silencing factor [Clostridia bacterium]|nr:ribosome silencing factor [Clostridia bacterium]